MSKIIKFLSICLAILTISGGCSAGKVALKENNGLTKVTIQIDGAAVPYYAPLYYAKEKGFFKEEGLDVDFIYADASTVLKNVAIGNVEFGFPNGDAVISAVANGVPIHVIHTTYQEGIGAILSLENNPITKPSDLKGKTIAVTSIGSPNYVQLQALATEEKFTLGNDIEVKVVGGSAITESLRRQYVDAIIFSRVRYYALKAQGVPVVEVPMEEYIPSYGNVLVANNDIVKNHPEVAQKFLRAFNKSLKDLTSGHLTEALNIALEYAPNFKGQEEQLLSTLENFFVPSLWQSELTQKYGFGYANMNKWNEMGDLQFNYGLIPEKLNAEDFVMQPSDILGGEKNESE